MKKYYERFGDTTIYFVTMKTVAIIKLQIDQHVYPIFYFESTILKQIRWKNIMKFSYILYNESVTIIKLQID